MAMRFLNAGSDHSVKIINPIMRLLMDPFDLPQMPNPAHSTSRCKTCLANDAVHTFYALGLPILGIGNIPDSLTLQLFSSNWSIARGRLAEKSG
jgi:hypothetical protein